MFVQNIDKSTFSCYLANKANIGQYLTTIVLYIPCLTTLSLAPVTTADPCNAAKGFGACAILL